MQCGKILHKGRYQLLNFCQMLLSTGRYRKPHGQNILLLHLLFHIREHGRERFIGEVLLVLGEGIGLLAQRPIVGEMNIAKGTSKELLLLARRAQPKIIGMLLFHVLHSSRDGGKEQQVTSPFHPQERLSMSGPKNLSIEIGKESNEARETRKTFK